MNKKLLALAVGAAISVPSIALADGPRVYGKVNVSLEQVEEDLDTGSEDTDSQWQLDSNASRLGVKGDFDLDVGGLTAVYKAEYEIAVDDGDAVFKQRNIFGGFEGSFGRIIAGNFDTPLKTSQGKIDQFNDLDGDIKTIMAGEIREQNIIQWTSPELADALTINVALIPGEGREVEEVPAAAEVQVDDGLADATSLSVVYDQGGLYAALAMDSNITDSLETDDTYTDGSLDDTIDITRLTAGFKGDNFQVGALYQMAEESEADGEESSMVLSGAFSIDRLKLKAQYGMTEAEGTDGNETELTLTAFGVDYKLASASKVYGYFAEVEGDDGADSLSDTTVGFGFEHKF